MVLAINLPSSLGRFFFACTLLAGGRGFRDGGTACCFAVCDPQDNNSGGIVWAVLSGVDGSGGEVRSVVRNFISGALPSQGLGGCPMDGRPFF